MAIYTGHIKFTGRIGNVSYYKVGNEIYVRQISSLNGKRFKKDPRFRKTMAYAGLMARASKIASTVYRALPRDFRQFWMYRSFTGEAMRMLKAGGMTDEEILYNLRKTYVEVTYRRTEAEPLPQPVSPYPQSI